MQNYTACILCYRNFNVLIRELLSGWILLPIADVLADPAVVNSLLLLFLDNYTLSQYPNRPPTRVEFLARFVSSVPISHDSVSISCVSSKAIMQITVECQQFENGCLSKRYIIIYYVVGLNANVATDGWGSYCFECPFLCPLISIVFHIFLNLNT